MNEHIPNIETYVKRLNWYLQEHYPANKKITAEEWNALFLALMNQGNTQEDTLEKICNEILPLHITAINYLLDAESDHSSRITTLEDTTAEHNTRIDILEVDTLNSKNRIKTLESTVDNHSNIIDNHSNRIDILEVDALDSKNRIKLLEDNKAGNIILDGDSYQDNMRNIYYEKDGFKSEGVFFNKANHEAYLLDADLELNLSPVNIGGVCFVASFMQPDSTVNPDIYAQGEILITSDFWASDSTGVFYREIYIRKSTEHPSGYVGVREETTQQGRYYFTPIMDASVINKIKTLIQNLDRNKVSQSQLVETNQNIDKKVDKKTTSGNYVYTHIGEVQGEARFSNGAEDNAIVQRTVGGYVYVPNTYPQDKFPDVAMGSVAVNKAYVDLGFGVIQANLIGEVLPSEEENGYKQVLTFKGLKGEDGTALTLFTTELSLPKTNLEITEDSALFKYTFTLKDNKGNVLSTKTIDLPLEELVVDGLYNNTTKSIILTLKNGNTVNIPVGDLVEGLVNSTDLQNALDTKVDKVSGKGLSTNDLTDELVAKINSALQEHQPLDNYATLEQVNSKYTKPTTGIPKTDLESSVQSSLNKADTALQEHQSLANYATLSQVNAKYTKPTTGIPKTDLDSNVQSSLSKADTALQEHQDISGKADKTEIPTKVSQLENDENYLKTETDPTVPAWAKQANKPTYTAEEVGALPNTTQYVSSVNGQSGAITGVATQTEVDKKVDKTAVSESVVANSVVKRTVDGDILVNDDNTAMASKPSNIAVSKGYVQYIMTTLSELFGQNLEAVISSISSSASADGYTQTLTFKNLNDTGIGTLDIVMPKTNLEITEDSSLFKYTFTLKDSKGNTLSTKTIDLPLEELVVNGSYNNVTKSIVLTLKNGNTADIPVGDLVEGLVNSTDLQNALSIKVDKVDGKGLSTNDYTNTDKAKLNGLANIKTIGDNLTLDEQGKLSAKVASGVSSINGQTGAVTGIATTEEVNTAKQSANSYTDTKTGEISTALQQNTAKINELEKQNKSQSSQIDVLKKLYAVGSIYMSTNSTSPAELFGGTWEQITEKFLLASSQLPTANNPNPTRTYIEKNSGGSASVTLTGNNLPNILQVGQNKSGVEKWISGCEWTNQPYADQAFIITQKSYLNEVGNNYIYNQPHDNMPPYYVVNIWRRTA